MTSKEKLLIADLLSMASETYSNHGCNDTPDSLFKNWTLEERQDLVKEYYDCSRESEEYNPNHLHISDWCLMSFLARKLRRGCSHENNIS